MTVPQAVGGALTVLIAVLPAHAQIANKWVEQRCGLGPGHYLVNSGVLYLKKGVESRAAADREKSLADAERVLREAVTAKGQQDNPAAWYYLGRYYHLREDAAGADSAFARAQRLRPECADDIDTWRQMLWAPVFNAGVAAWQAGNTDSALATFTRATLLNPKDANGPIYVGVLYANKDQVDSAIKYFRIGIDLAGNDTSFAEQKKQATFNLARMYHRTQRWDEASGTYRAFLEQHPDDIEGAAGLGAVYCARGMRDSARTAYQRVLDRAQSAGYVDLFHAGVSIFQCAPPAPDSATITDRCRSQVRGTAAVVRRTCRDSVTKAVEAHRDASGENYQLAARAFEAVLAKNPYYRDALFNLSNTYYQLRDTSKFLPVAQRLVAVDPMHRTSNLLLAQAFQMRAQGDSALHYLQVSDSILPVEVSVTELSLSDSSADVGGVITNFHKRPSKPLTIAFEFLNLKGEVVATSDYSVPAVDPEGNHPFRVSAQGPAITAYRYRQKS